MNMKKEICPTPRIECTVAIPGKPCGIEVLNKLKKCRMKFRRIHIDPPHSMRPKKKYVPIKQNASIDKTAESVAETQRKSADEVTWKL